MPLTPVHAAPSTTPAAPVALSVRDLLVRGLLAGLLAGIAAFAVAYVVGEPSVSSAISLESSDAAHDHAAEDHADATEVPRSLQSTVGLLTATAVAGTTLGGLVGVLSALALGRFGRLGPRGVPLLVAGLGFVATYVVPFLGYPPNPPAVGQPETIGYRTSLYFLLVAISLVAGVAAVIVARRLAPLWGTWWATLASLAGYLVLTLGAIAFMPTYDEVPADFPATVLWSFRRASFVTQLALWGVLGLALAELTHRLTVRGRRVPQTVGRAA